MSAQPSLQLKTKTDIRFVDDPSVADVTMQLRGGVFSLKTHAMDGVKGQVIHEAIERTKDALTVSYKGERFYDSVHVEAYMDTLHDLYFARGAGSVFLGYLSRFAEENRVVINVFNDRSAVSAPGVYGSDSIFLNPDFKPRPAQKYVVDALIHRLKTVKSKRQYSRLGGVIMLPTGGGKTETAMYIGARMVEDGITSRYPKTLILVPNKNLVNGWKQRIEQGHCLLDDGYSPKVITRLSTRARGFDKANFCVTTYQSLMNITPEKEEALRHFSMTVCDECHKVGASEMIMAAMQSRSLFTIGLSATPERSDNAHKLFRYLFPATDKPIEPPLEIRNNGVVPVDYYIINYDKSAPYINDALRNINEHFMWKQGYETRISKDGERMSHIAALAVQTVRSTGKTIVFCSRKKEADTIGQILSEFFHADVTVAHGSKRKKIADVTSDILVTTKSYAGEGVDTKDYDVVISTFPMTRRSINMLKQCIGRVRREREGKDFGEVYVITDTGSEYHLPKNASRASLRALINEGGIIRDAYEIEMDEVVETGLDQDIQESLNDALLSIKDEHNFSPV
ncbi:MAG: DEAD/DEAH box helicase [Methanobacteriota archaeon]|nr:MAG: DEAD/DEAH box helicase [Euryarchaeota archaeon]